MRNKYISRFLRSIGLAWAGDYTRFQLMRIRNRKQNQLFRKQHPGVILPPDYTLYESFQMDYGKYYVGGREDAEWIISLAKPYCNLSNGRILDWGCGPCRILRHFPELLGPANEYYGTDYNLDTILWCKANLKGIAFSNNQINPPLPFRNDHFDLIYGISIFTHLSKENHFHWSDELYRILSPVGVLIVTTHGEAFLERLTEDEQAIFGRGELVSRTKVKEGHRMYAAFHPPSFIKHVFVQSGFSILRHIPGSKVNDDFIQQDVWILKSE